MSDVYELFEIIGARLGQSGHSELLKMLVDSFMEGRSEAIEAKIKEILSKIEGE